MYVLLRRLNRPVDPADASNVPTTPSINLDAQVDLLVAQVTQFATLPEVAIQVVQLVEDSHSTASDLHKVIATDPALSTRILKIVNSAFYGLPSQVATLERAIVLLGLNAVKNLTIASGMSQLYGGGVLVPGVDARQLWNHAITTATAARLLAPRVDYVDQEEAFLAGLIHNIGLLVQWQVNTKQMGQVVELWRQSRHPKRREAGGRAVHLRQAERFITRVDHERLGARLCMQWGFPPHLAAVAGMHHQPHRAEESHQLMVALIYAADVLATRLLEGTWLGAETDEINEEMMALLKLDAGIVDELMSVLPKTRDQASAMFADAH